MAKKTLSAREARADFWGGIYLAFGPGRSLQMVRDRGGPIGTSIGMKVPSLRTLKRYSSQYGWDQKARDHDARYPPPQAAEDEKPPESGADRAYRLALEADERTAQIARALQAVGAEAMSLVNVKDINAIQAARILEIGVKMDRLASGAVTERTEISMRSINAVLNYSHAAFEAAVARLRKEPSVPAAMLDEVISTYVDTIDGQVTQHLHALGVEL